LPHAGYKSELIRGPGQGPWTRIEDVELATLGWVHWFNTTRLHEHLDYVPPAEFEAVYAAEKADRELVGVIQTELPSNPGRVQRSDGFQSELERFSTPQSAPPADLAGYEPSNPV
jgi:hypothetical protein